LVDLLAAPGLRRYWHNRKHWYSDEFSEFVETTMEAVEETDGAIYEQHQQFF